MISSFQTTVIDLSYRHNTRGYGLISVFGKDAEKFLQGQLTSDITQITPTSHGLSAYCNLKGRIRALFTLFFYNDCYYLQCPHAILSNTLNTLKKYARFSKVELNDVSDKWDMIGVSIQGLDSSVSNKTLFNYISAQTHFTDLLCFPEKKEILVSGQLASHEDNILVLALPDPHARFLLLGPLQSIKTLRKRLNVYEINPSQQAKAEKNGLYDKGTFEDWMLLNIKAGIPEIWPETVEKFLPHSLNLPALKAVSFNKGCYCGQEIIARMEYRANIKKHMYRATLENTTKIPEPGSTLKPHPSASEDIGTVIMASQSALKIEMLIETQAMYANTSNSLFLMAGETTIPLVIEEKFIANKKGGDKHV